MMPVSDPSWVPDACTLPTAEQPLRAREFDELFRDATTGVQRVDAQRARLVLRPEPGVAARAADLAVRETQCCSFFGFTLSATGGELTMDITAPPGQVDVLDALVDRARASGRAGLAVSEGLRAGQVAAAAGVNLQTLRYYERRGSAGSSRTAPWVGTGCIRRRR